MFDLRYHVVSLAAVFLALIVGILVGVGISDPGLADEIDREVLEERLARAERERDTALARAGEAEAAEAFTRAAYATVMHERLADRQIAIVFVGRVDPDLEADVRKAIVDAGGQVVRLRALKVPLREEDLETVLAARPAFGGYRGREGVTDLGRELGRELVAGGETPLWDALTATLVEQQGGRSKQAADGVVVIRSAPPQRRATARFLDGFLEGMTAADRAVGVEASSAASSAVEVYRRAGLSSVDAVDTAPGKVALAVVLAGGRPGHYGVKATRDAVLPPIEPVALERAKGE